MKTITNTAVLAIASTAILAIAFATSSQAADTWPVEDCSVYEEAISTYPSKAEFIETRFDCDQE